MKEIFTMKAKETAVMDIGSMQNLAVILFFAFALGLPGILDAAYVIKLKSGNQFTTGRYWCDRTQIMFELPGGGILGIDRSQIETIGESTNPLLPSLDLNSLSNVKPTSAVKVERQDDRLQPPRVKSEVKPELDPILRDFDALKDRSRLLSGMPTSALEQLSKNLTELKRRIQRSGRTKNYLSALAQI